MGISFSKYEGLGNDFIVVPEKTPVDAKAARLWCDRHTGVGADGVLVVGDGPSMKVWNADGSHAQMCGNGLRCVAWHRARTGDASPVQWNTDAGPHHAVVHGAAGGVADVEIQMAVPTLVPAEVPVLADGPLVDADFELPGVELTLSAVGMGNPHAVIFDVRGDRFTLGPAIQASARFPEGVNVGFASLGDAELELHVLERGAGWTRACGTGACAAAVAAVETGRWDRGRPLPVRLPGGVLTITVGEPGTPVSMRGPARHVFDGVLSEAQGGGKA